MPRPSVPRSRPVRLIVAALLGLILGACGGGSGPDTQVLGEQVSQDDAAPTPAPDPAPDAEPAPVPSDPETTPVAPPDAPPAAGSPEALTLDLRLDSTEVSQGADVRGALVVTNPTSDSVDITHPSSCDIEAGLYSGGELASEPRACAAMVTPDSIGPGETRSFPVRIPTGDLPAGTYEARAALDLVNGDRAATPVTVTVTAAVT